jgi:hypothetical protein
MSFASRRTMLALDLRTDTAHRRPPVSSQHDPLSHDPLLSFEAEAVPAGVAPTEPVPDRRTPGTRLAVPLVGLLMVLVLTLAGVRAWSTAATSSAVAVRTGTVDMTSLPGGAAVTIDGQARGVTPLHLSLTAGPHLAEVTSDGVRSSLLLTVEPDVALRQHVAFALGTSPLPTVGASPPASAAANAAPVPVGEHRVVGIEGTGASPAGAAPVGAAGTAAGGAAAAAPEIGWAQITVPIEIVLSERGRVIPPNASGRFRLTPGYHDLDVTNSTLDFRSTLGLTVAAGRTTRAVVGLPSGSVSINALPWANVSIDARAIGVTPIGNLSIPIGLHEVIWRHPEFGERRQTITVTERAPVGVGMDFTK